MTDIEFAKAALDKIIMKSRVHLYKPIQIAEILYRHRTMSNTINLLNLDDYRNQSKKWRNDISIVLLGRICTSSARFQDDLFNDNAIPPTILNILGKENIRTNGAVEAYIYSRFTNKHTQLSKALNYCLKATKNDFKVIDFINSFRKEAGLKRSIDKVYEIIVYALFSTLVSALELKVEVIINMEKREILNEFADFTKMIMCFDIDNVQSVSEMWLPSNHKRRDIPQNTSFTRSIHYRDIDNVVQNIQDAKIFRVGVTNAADRGLDMYSNWGLAIQVKHLSLNEELAEEIVDGVSSNRIVIVCKEAEEKIIVSLLNQIGWRNRIQSIVTETNLVDWYEKALRGKYAEIIGDELLTCLCEEISNEFPSLEETPEILKGRGYDEISDEFWNVLG